MTGFPITGRNRYRPLVSRSGPFPGGAGLGRRWRLARHFFEVDPCAECRVRAGQDDCVDTRVAPGGTDGIPEGVHQCSVEGVARLGPVQGQRGHPVLDLDDDERITLHGAA